MPRRLISLFAICFFMTSCAVKPSLSTNSAASVTAVEGVLTVGIPSEPGGLDICLDSDSAAQMVVRNFCEGLFAINFETSEYEPWLAEEWEYIDELTLRIYLRNDVIFHNDRPMVAEDVLFSLKRIADSPTASWITEPIDLDNCKTVDLYTVDIKTFDVFSPLIAYLSDIRVAIVSRYAVEEVSQSRYSRQPLGATGPYQFKEWISGHQIVFQRNDAYWGPIAEFDELVFYIIPDAVERTAALEAEDIDICWLPLNSSIPRLEEDGLFDTFRFYDYATTNIIFNIKTCEQLADVRVRQALNYALDVGAIGNSAYDGTGQISYFIAPSQMQYYRVPQTQYGYDIQKARSLLSSVNYSSDAVLQIWTSDNQSFIDLAQLAKVAWEEVGISCKVTILDEATLYERMSRGEHEVVVLEWAPNSLDFDLLYRMFSSESSMSVNYFGYSNPDFDTMMEQARHITGLSVKQHIYAQIVDMLAWDSPYIAVRRTESVYAMRTTLTGSINDPRRVLYLGEIHPKDN